MEKVAKNSIDICSIQKIIHHLAIHSISERKSEVLCIALAINDSVLSNILLCMYHKRVHVPHTFMTL